MRIIAVEPGPQFSVQDVHAGWVKGLTQAGCQVRNFNLSDRITFAETAIRGRVPAHEKGHMAARMVAEQLRAACFDYWPDLVLITSAFLVPPETFDVIRSRGIRIAVLLTESPYEDPSQIPIAARADMAIINDPTNLDQFRETQPNTWYIPHAYDPDQHHPGQPSADLQAQFGWVGTAFPSRIEFFQAVDWTGIDAAFAGNWQALPAGSPLEKFLVHDREGCFPNNYTADLYRSVDVSANLYRKEGAEGHSDGWAMGPREVELAACRTFFLRESRPESDELFPMLPTFDGPEDFGDKLRWWLDHPRQRDAAAGAAYDAIHAHTFRSHAVRFCEYFDSLPSCPTGR